MIYKAQSKTTNQYTEAGMSNQINGFRPDRLGLIKHEIVDLLEDNNVPDEVIAQVVRLITEVKTLASNQKADYLSERLSRGKQK